MVDATRTSHRSDDVSRRAVARLREALAGQSLDELADIDAVTGDLVDPEARALFASLPTVTPATTPDDLVGHGLLTRPPNNLRSVFLRPKYRPGREVFVRTAVSHESNDPLRPVGRYDPDGETAFTHLGRLVGKNETGFWVDVEDSPSSLDIAEADLFSWNEPSGVLPSGGTLSGIEVDYNDPIFKAQICAAYLDLSEDIASLDFDIPEESATEMQTDIVYRLASKIQCRFLGRGSAYRGTRAGALLARGQGSSFAQRAVAVAFLQAFGRVLAFEVQAAVGRTIRLKAPHGFAVVTLRPSMKRFVCDPAWAEPLTDLRVAFFGPSWGHDRRLLGFDGQQPVSVRAEEVDAF